MPNEARGEPVIPLARWADRQLRLLAEETGSPAIAALDGATLLGERATINGLAIPSRRSAGRKCHLLAARDGWFALNLARDADRDLLPALFGKRLLDTSDLGEIAEQVFDNPIDQLVSQGRELGLAVAGDSEKPRAQPCFPHFPGTRAGQPARPPLVVDLSALWAGPLCSHLLQLAGARVIKVESTSRPDAMRHGDAAFFGLINQLKDNVTADLARAEGREALLSLIARADIVIEAARPRALEQLGIDASAILGEHPDLTWITITGHGVEGGAGNWIGFGDDCGVSGGLTHALLEATGEAGFVGDAIADPLTGIVAARTAWSAFAGKRGGRYILAMSSIAALALDEERAFDPALLETELVRWGRNSGRPFPSVQRRKTLSPPKPLGADNDRWLSC